MDKFLACNFKILASCIALRRNILHLTSQFCKECKRLFSTYQKQNIVRFLLLKSQAVIKSSLLVFLLQTLMLQILHKSLRISLSLTACILEVSMDNHLPKKTSLITPHTSPCSRWFSTTAGLISPSLRVQGIMALLCSGPYMVRWPYEPRGPPLACLWSVDFPLWPYLSKWRQGRAKLNCFYS